MIGEGHGVYLICFERPYAHARHYLGWASNVDDRVAEHRSGRGSRLLDVVNKAGIDWQVVRVWRGAEKDYERRLKRNGASTRYCPRCTPGTLRASEVSSVTYA